MKAPHIKNDLNQTRDFYYFDKKDNEWWIDTEDGYAEEILSKELVQKLDMIYKIKAKSNFKEEIRSTLNEGIGDKALDKIFNMLRSDLWDDLKLSHSQATKLTHLIGDLIEKELKTAISENIDSHEEMGGEHRKLKKQLELAKQYMEKKRRLHKADPTNDQARFQFQDAISLVNKLEKELWKY